MSDTSCSPIVVNGEELSDAFVERELKILFDRYSQQMSEDELMASRPQIISEARHRAVQRTLLTQQAGKEITDINENEIDERFRSLMEQYGGEDAFRDQFNITPDDEPQMRADVALEVRFEKYLDQICVDVPRPTSEDSRLYYDENPTDFDRPEMLHIAQVAQRPSPDMPAEEVYEYLMGIRDRALGGEDFIQIIEEIPNGEDGGHEVGWFCKGTMTPAFEECAFSTPVGEISDMLKTEFGYHLMKVIDRKEPARLPYDEVKSEIETMLFDAKKNEVIAAKVDELRVSAVIENLENPK